MASFVNNTVFTAAAAGAGPFTVAAAAPGYESPAGRTTDGKSYRYRAQSANNLQWETGTAVASGGGTVFSRSVSSSSTGGGTVDFTSPPNVMLSFFAADFLQFDDAMSLTLAQTAQARANIAAAGLNVANNFTDATEATGAGTTASALFAGGVEIAKKLFVGGAVKLTNTTDATGAGTTAALLVAGGAEVAKKLFVGGVATFTDATEATGAGTTASALFAGGVEIAKKLFVVGNVKLSSATEATGAGTTAALLVVGGAEVAKKLFVGGTAKFTDATEATGAGTTASVLFAGGVEIAKKLFVGGTVKLTDTTEATGAGTTAALLIAGGLEIAKKLFVAGTAKFTDATEATGAGTTASALFAGGVEIAKKLFVAGVVAFTSANANALAVGPNGITNPTLQVDTVTASVATGLNIKGAAAGAGLALSVLSSGSNENLKIDAKGSGTITLNGIATGAVTTPRPFSITDTTDSSSSITGSLITAGGLGVAKAAYIGTTLRVGPGTDAATVTGAALILSNNGTTSFSVIDSANNLEFGMFTNHTPDVLVIGTRSTHPLWVQTNSGNNFAFHVSGGFSIGSTTDPGTNSLGVEGGGAFKNNVTVTLSTNALLGFIVANSNAGASAAARFVAGNGTSNVEFGQRGTGQTTYGELTANRSYIYGATDFVFMSDGGSLLFASNGNALKMKLTNGLMVGSTTDPGTGCLILGGTTASTTTTTGTLIVGGGAGIAGAINVGGNGTVSGNFVCLATASAFGPAGTGASASIVYLDGGSAANGGGQFAFRKNSVTKIYFGTESSIAGGGSTSDNFLLQMFGGFGSAILVDYTTGLTTAYGGILSISPTAGIGYGAGAGGSQTQLTNKGTGVTLNKVTGKITMNGASLAANTAISFILTNSAIAATDTLTVQTVSGYATPGTYQVWAEVAAAGSCKITIRNITAGALAEAVVLQYNVHKGAIT